jgi:serine/threonine protein kinase
MKRSPYTQQSTRTSLTGTGSTWRIPSNQSGADSLGQGYRAKSLILDSALVEYRRLREQGQSIDRDEFCAKFPDYRKSLLRLIDVEENLGDLGEIADPFPEVGETLLGFDILDRIGVGAIARVYLAAEPELGGRTVVIKVSTEGTAEAAILGKLQHPNIVQVYSVKKDEASGMTAVCMPYQGSATLTDILDLSFQAGRPPDSASVILDVGRRLADLNALRDDDLVEHRPDSVLHYGTFVDGVVHLGIQLADALEYAHTCGILHRDLKPSNVLLTPYGRPMLLDFNLSFDASRDAMPRGGTLPYMAPEQIRAGIRGDLAEGAADPRSDAFSLGVILYELLTGKLPYGGPPDNIGPQAASLWQLDAHETPPQPLQDLNPNVSPQIAAIVERCLATSPKARFGSLAEVSLALRQHFTRTRRAKRWIRRHVLLCWILLAALMIPAVGAGAYSLLRPSFADRQYQAAVAAYKRGDKQQSFELLQGALERSPNDPKVLLLRGICYFDAGKRMEATADLQRVVEIVPSAVAYDYLGCAAYWSGHFEESAQYFERAIGFDPGHRPLYFKHAYVASSSSSLKQSALAKINDNPEMSPKTPDEHLVRGQCFQANSLFDEAQRDYDLAMKLAPTSIPVRLYVIGRLEKVIKTRPSARLTLQSIIEEMGSLKASKSTLSATAASGLFQNEIWWQELFQNATDGNAERATLARDLLAPSISPNLDQ